MPHDNGYRPPPPFAPPPLRREPLAAGSAAWGSAPTPRRGRKRLLRAAAAALVAALAVAAALLAVNRLDPVLHSLSLPRHAAGFSLQRSLSAAEIDALAAGGGVAGFAGAQLRSARIGIYGETVSGLPTLILIGLSARADRGVRTRLETTDPSDMVADVFAGFGSAPARSIDPGPLGGAIGCGSIMAGATSGALGVWADRSTLGVVELR